MSGSFLVSTVDFAILGAVASRHIGADAIHRAHCTAYSRLSPHGDA
jgi:hypothetical protein